MTGYFLRTGGNDSNAGTSPATAWATWGKALGAAGVGSGDILYVGGGTYREGVTIAGIYSTLTQIICDVTGQFTGDSGRVILSGYTTNDTTLPVGVPTLSLNGKSNLSFQDLIIVGGTSNPTCFNPGPTAGSNITFTRCKFNTGFLPGTLFNLTAVVNTTHNWLFDSCIFFCGSGGVCSITGPTSTLADYDLGITYKNCKFLNGSTGDTINLATTGANSFKPGGPLIQNCTFWGGNRAVIANVTAWSTSIPCKVYNSIIFASLFSGATGQIIDDYNLFIGSRTNVTAGANSTSNASKLLLFETGEAALYGFDQKPFMMPVAGSPFLGYGNTGAVPALTVDLLGKPRPSGGGSISNSIGVYERYGTAAKETTTVRTGLNAVNITGPGNQEFQVPVDAALTTLSVYARYDTNHGATSKPQVMVVNGEECGVSQATATMTAGVDTWEQLSLTFTPTAKGVVTLRLISRAAAGTGKAFFDDFSGGATGTQGFDYFRRGGPVGVLVAGSGSSAVFNPIGSQLIKGGY